MPTVSVVIPTCNRPEFLARALKSVVAQTYEDFELIVVDDGTGAEAVAGSFGDARVRCISNKKNKGAAGARNTGAADARGAYIAFLDDDDQWVPEKLYIQMAVFEHASSRIAFCFSAVRNVYDNREEVTRIPAGEMSYLERALTRFSGFLTSTLIIRKEAFLETGGFDASLPSHQEPDLIIRLSQKYDGIGVDEPLTVMSMRTSYEHIGSSLERRIAGRIALLSKHATLFSKRPKVLAKHYFRIGLWNRDSGKRREAQKYFLLALRTSFSFRVLFHFLRSLFP